MRATPSITRLFAATFIAVALVGLVTQVATWRGARATQTAMVELAQRLDHIQRLNPSRSVAAEATAASELAADAGDDAVQAALAASVLFVAMLIVLGLGFWYNRRRLAAPFARIASALQRVAEGQFVESLPENQPAEFGAIARGVNHMAKALAWREELQAYLSQLLAALPQGLVLVPLRSGTKLSGVLGVVPGERFGIDERAALEQAAPNLAIACERASAHHNTRRLAVEGRQTAKRLEQLNTELDAAMKTKDQFLSNISHELRTPLNSIIGFTDLLLTQDLGPALSDQQRDFLDTVARNGRQLLELINELLDLQRIAAGRMELKPEAVELAGLLSEAAGSVHAQVQKHGHALVVTPLPQDLRVHADRGRVRQVLLNLLSNAIKFTPDGGRITVAAAPVNGGAEARIAVSDTGIGIAPEDQPKLFQEV